VLLVSVVLKALCVVWVVVMSLCVLVGVIDVPRSTIREQPPVVVSAASMSSIEALQ
jgi:hypothetical protein